MTSDKFIIHLGHLIGHAEDAGPCAAAVRRVTAPEISATLQRIHKTRNKGS